MPASADPRATVRDLNAAWAEGRPDDIDGFGNVAVADLAWHIAYTMGGEAIDQTGRDVYVPSRGDDGWKVAWRTMIVDGGE